MRGAERLAAAFRRLTPPERRVALEAMAFLSLASLARRVRPRRFLRPLLTTVPAPGTVERALSSERIAALVDAVAVRLPWTTSCLDRALAARWILARRGIPAALVIGAASPPFVAHAWLELADRPARGVSGHRALWRHE